MFKTLKIVKNWVYTNGLKVTHICNILKQKKKKRNMLFLAVANKAYVGLALFLLAFKKENT